MTTKGSNMPDQRPIDDAERLRRIELIAAAGLLIAAQAYSDNWRRDRWKRKIKDALWPFL